MPNNAQETDSKSIHTVHPLFGIVSISLTLRHCAISSVLDFAGSLTLRHSAISSLLVFASFNITTLLYFFNSSTSNSLTIAQQNYMVSSLLVFASFNIATLRNLFIACVRKF
jgi:hypothetical protein